MADPLSRDKYYTEHRIPKPNGGVRILHEPCEPLKTIQRKLAHSLRIWDSMPSSLAYKWKPVMSCYSKLKQAHGGTPFMMKVDIKDFFPSIKPNMVGQMTISNRGISYVIAETGIPIIELTTMTDRLPQGAPTSPIISNLIMRNIDIRMEKYMRRHHRFAYTRYADDIHMSLGRENIHNRSSFDKAYKFLMTVIYPHLKRMLRKKGMFLNYSKTRKMFKNSNKICALGMVLNERDKEGIGRKEYNRYRGWIHQILTRDHTQAEVDRLQGQLSHVYHVDPTIYNKLVADKYNAIIISILRAGSTRKIPEPV